MNIETFLKLVEIPNNLTIDEILDSLILYLRKSRKDSDYFKGETIEKTLARHEKQLQEFIVTIFGKPIPEHNIFREVASGDTIDGRPVMQKVLSLIENDKYKGVICIEIERLARGNTLDQGIIAQTFQYTKTKIITPIKIFNLDNEDDLSYFEDGLFQSRKFLKYTKRILARGRTRSVKDGNYIGSILPYGFDKVKIPGEKGFILVENEFEGNNIRLMAKLFLNGLKTTYTVQENDTTSSISKKFGITQQKLLKDNLESFKENRSKITSKNFFEVGKVLTIEIKDMRAPNIANYFNYLKITPRKSSIWTSNMIRNILLSYPVYGYLTWNRRKTVATLVDGKIVKKCPYNFGDDLIIQKGKHKPILSEEVGKKIQEKFKANSNKMSESTIIIKNPLKGLVVCGYCGSNMIRRPYKKLDNKKKRVCNIDKEELRLFLRDHKGDLCLNQIAKELNTTKDVVSHWFASKSKYFVIPPATKWLALKQILNIKTDKYDTDLTNEVDVVPHVDTLLCPKKDCKCVASNLDLVECQLIQILKELKKDFKSFIDNYDKSIKKQISDNNELMISLQHEIEKSNLQLEKICELLETGAYTQDLFLKRSKVINQKIESLKKQIKELSKPNSSIKELKYKKNAVPIIEDILSKYKEELSPEEKNELLSYIIEKVIYTKEQGGRNKMDAFNLSIELKRF